MISRKPAAAVNGRGDIFRHSAAEIPLVNPVFALRYGKICDNSPPKINKLTRNCLSNWLKDEADAKGVDMSKDESREAVYGMPYDTWKSTYQGTASPEQLAAMKKAHSGH